MRVAAAVGAGRRRQSKHALDPERHLRRGFGHDNFAVRARVPRQLDQAGITQRVHSLLRHHQLRAAHKIVNDTGAQVEHAAAIRFAYRNTCESPMKLRFSIG